MGKGSFLGGSKVVGPKSGWFTISPKSPRQVSKSVALGNQLAAKREDDRKNWKALRAEPLLMSPEEFAAAFPKKAPSISFGSEVAVADRLSSRERRQAAKRRRLGID